LIDSLRQMTETVHQQVRKATCLSDNQCFGPAMAGEGIYCVVDKKEKEK
jgi:hypothetical protein